MGMNYTIACCPFTRQPVDQMDDPAPAFDGISYYGQYEGVRFRALLNGRDLWLADSWLKEHGLAFIAELHNRNQLSSYFSVPRSLDKVKADYAFYHRI